MIAEESQLPARLIQIGKSRDDFFSKVQAAILERFSDLSLSSSTLQIYWKDEDGDDISIVNTDDLRFAMDSNSRGPYKLYIRTRPRSISGMNSFIILFKVFKA